VTPLIAADILSARSRRPRLVGAPPRQPAINRPTRRAAADSAKLTTCTNDRPSRGCCCRMSSRSTRRRLVRAAVARGREWRAVDRASRVQAGRAVTRRRRRKTVLDSGHVRATTDLSPPPPPRGRAAQHSTSLLPPRHRNSEPADGQPLNSVEERV